MLEDLNKMQVAGLFYEPEMVLVKGKGKDSEFLVEKILAKRTRKGHTQILIKWKGYPDLCNSWEPASHLVYNAQVYGQLGHNHIKHQGWNMKSTLLSAVNTAMIIFQTIIHHIFEYVWNIILILKVHINVLSWIFPAQQPSLKLQQKVYSFTSL